MTFVVNFFVGHPLKRKFEDLFMAAVNSRFRYLPTTPKNVNKSVSLYKLSHEASTRFRNTDGSAKERSSEKNTQIP